MFIFITLILALIISLIGLHLPQSNENRETILMIGITLHLIWFVIGLSYL